MNRKTFARLRKGILGAVTFTALFAYSQEYEIRDNYVELGKMRGQSSFEVVSPSEVSETFRIPVFKKSDYKDRAVGAIKEPVVKKKVKITNVARERLRRKLARISIIPIPKFDFGKERRLKRKNIGWSSSNYQEIKSYKLKRKQMPNVLRNFLEISKVDMRKASKKKINLKKVSQKVILQSEVDAIKFLAKENFKFNEEKLHLKEPKDLELLTADILYDEKNSCEEVVPLTEFLSNKKTKDNRIKYYRGMCLHDNKMFSESIPLLSEVIGTSTPYYSKSAVDKILTGLPKGYESVIAEGLAPKTVYSRLDDKQKNAYNYILAKGNFINEKFKRSEGHAKLVTTESPTYHDAQFIVATSQYMNGRLQRGIATLSQLKKDYFKLPNADVQFKSLIHVTLGRFLFERGAYKQAIKEYEQVSREHPLWVDSLIEKGWSQIRVKDFAGAIGNMYTLQSPFFKDAFIPESHVIRTIGYLNLCQFGDANNSLSILETEYPEQKKEILSYIKSNKSHYQTLTNYITKDTSKIYEYDGVATSVIREMGRDRDYLVIQTKLNNVVDEIPMFKKFASQVMGKRTGLLSEISKLTEKSKKMKEKEAKAIQAGNTDLAKALKKERKGVFVKGNALRYRIDTFNKGIIAYKKVNGNSVKRAEKYRDGFLVEAENTLKESMAKVDSRLELVLRNNDLLRYEVFANSGKNIRYRVAGGKTRIEEAGPERLPASIKGKDYNWKFKGEFWEDEIGNFSSQLRNLCPKK